MPLVNRSYTLCSINYFIKISCFYLNLPLYPYFPDQCCLHFCSWMSNPVIYRTVVRSIFNLYRLLTFGHNWQLPTNILAHYIALLSVDVDAYSTRQQLKIQRFHACIVINEKMLVIVDVNISYICQVKMFIETMFCHFFICFKCTRSF